MTDSIDIIFVEALDCYVEIEYEAKLRSIRFVKSKGYLKDRKTQSTSYDLERYFNGEKIDFSCELDISHLSLFAQKVLEETRKIKYGKTITYSELARKTGCRGARAVGRALASNPIPIVIPCHRVVAKHGIGGFSAGVDIKTRLLELEKAKANNL